jgi:hypothetical protein
MIRYGLFQPAIRMSGAEFGDAGLVTYAIDDAATTVTIVDVTWIG